MKPTEIIEILRAVVRPYLSVLLGTTMAGLAVYLAVTYANLDLARYVVTAVVTAGVSLFSYYTGERAGKKKEDK